MAQTKTVKDFQILGVDFLLISSKLHLNGLSGTEVTSIGDVLLSFLVDFTA